MKLKSWHKEAIRAALIVGLTLLTMGACQSMPAEWRIGAGGAVRAALGCIDEDDSKLTRRQRVARCTGRILAEAGEVAEAIGEATLESAPQIDEVTPPPAPRAPMSSPLPVPPESDVRPNPIALPVAGDAAPATLEGTR